MLGSVTYYVFLAVVAYCALRALMPRRRRERLPYRPFGVQTPRVRQGTTLLYGTTASEDGPGTAGATKAASPLPRPPGTPGNMLFPPQDGTTMLTTHPLPFNPQWPNTVSTTTAGGDASITLTSGDTASPRRIGTSNLPAA